MFEKYDGSEHVLSRQKFKRVFEKVHGSEHVLSGPDSKSVSEKSETLLKAFLGRFPFLRKHEMIELKRIGCCAYSRKTC